MEKKSEDDESKKDTRRLAINAVPTAVDNQFEEGGLDLLELYPLRANTPQETIFVEILLNGKEVRMELDTGAAVSVMSLSAFERIRGKGQGQLQESKLVLKTYRGISQARGNRLCGGRIQAAEVSAACDGCEGECPSIAGKRLASAA